MIKSALVCFTLAFMDNGFAKADFHFKRRFKLKAIVNSKINSESKEARGPNLWTDFITTKKRSR
jgi:hypothetical protein